MRRVTLTTLCTAIVLGLAATDVGAEDGDVLLEYLSSSGVKPVDDGWEMEPECLDVHCPDGEGILKWENPPGKWYAGPCYFQGQKPDDVTSWNDCEFAIGCNRLGVPGDDPSEHFNSPTGDNDGMNGSCHYTEWIVFDDGNDNAYGDSYPPNLPVVSRPLTHRDSYWGIHCAPPWGAPWFIGGPVGYSAIRLSNGGGTGDNGTKPAHDGVADKGSTKLRKSYTSPGPEAEAVTMVVRMAAGNRNRGHEMVQLRGMGYRVSFGVDGGYYKNAQGDLVKDLTNLGQLRWGGTDSNNPMPLPDEPRVQVAMSELGVWGPHAGEFFILRVILFTGGTFTAYLNENGAVSFTGATTSTSGDREVQFQPDTRNHNVMWIDYVQVLEGAIPPGAYDPCINRNPVFDVRDSLGGTAPDKFVDQQDYIVFEDCATGPGADPALFDPDDENYIGDTCYCMDVNKDLAIDQEDFGVFQICYTGSGPSASQVDPACDDLN